MIRIQLIVPLFAISCYSMLVNANAKPNKFILEPIREIYEAFVIYTFFSLLTDMLGGEKSIIITTSGRKPVKHPGFLLYIFSDIDISDPSSFLLLKRGILQYVWLKPFICLGTILSELIGVYNVNNLSAESIYFWVTILYNISVSLSLYCLAIFWKILWDDLKPFNPVGKFLCVKLIIFASYWQGVILAILNYFNVLPNGEEDGKNSNFGVSIQNGLLCVELIGFAIGHWISFSYRPFTLSYIPNSRISFWYAVRDMVGFKDLVMDFKLTFYGDFYKDYRSFDSVNAIIHHPNSLARMKKINKGARYSYDGRQKYWLPVNDQRSIAENGIIGDEYFAPSMRSFGTSTKGLVSNSPKALASPALSPPQLPDLAGNSDMRFSITDSLNNEEFNYDTELLDDDETLYHTAYQEINNYRLDQSQVKKVINYPVVDNVVDSHRYGYKVKKLREHRQSLIERGRSVDRGENYGSINV